MHLSKTQSAKKKRFHEFYVFKGISVGTFVSQSRYCNRGHYELEFFLGRILRILFHQAVKMYNTACAGATSKSHVHCTLM